MSKTHSSPLSGCLNQPPRASSHQVINGLGERARICRAKAQALSGNEGGRAVVRERARCKEAESGINQAFPPIPARFPLAPISSTGKFILYQLADELMSPFVHSATASIIIDSGHWCDKCNSVPDGLTYLNDRQVRLDTQRQISLFLDPFGAFLRVRGLGAYATTYSLFLLVDGDSNPIPS